jgi:hypothetical protein
MYSKAAAFLAAPLTRDIDILEECPALACDQNDLPHVSVAPLLDLASSECLLLKAETAQALEQAAMNSKLFVELCTPQAVLVYSTLLQLACFNIVKPLAGVLQCLAALPEAKNVLGDQDLLHAMIENIWAPATAPEGSQMLAQAVNNIVNELCSKSPHIAQSALTNALREKLRQRCCHSTATPTTFDESTADYLKGSLQALGDFPQSQNAMLCY